MYLCFYLSKRLQFLTKYLCTILFRNYNTYLFASNISIIIFYFKIFIAGR